MFILFVLFIRYEEKSFVIFLQNAGKKESSFPGNKLACFVSVKHFVVFFERNLSEISAIIRQELEQGTLTEGEGSVRGTSLI